MQISKKKFILIGLSGTLLLIVLLYFGMRELSKPDSYKVRKGIFEATINTKGQVKGERATQVNLPDILRDRNLRIYQLQIKDLVPEGKTVKRGDFIAKLDEGRIKELVQSNKEELDRNEAELRNQVIDSTITLTNARQDILNAQMELAYKQVDLEQSRFESPAYQRKAEMEYKRGEMRLEKEKRNYILEQNKLKARIVRFENNVKEFREKMEKLVQAIQATQITAPEDGIVMYTNWYDGSKIRVGHDITIWRPEIVLLPDMSSIISETYVKEIDIAKIRLGDKVRLKIDALPEKTFNGTIIKIANIGQAHKDFDTNVFEVFVRFDFSDPQIKPGMSTSNDIILFQKEDAFQVPVQALFSENGQPVVYVRKGSGFEVRPVKTGSENPQFVHIEEGLADGETVLLNNPNLKGKE